MTSDQPASPVTRRHWSFVVTDPKYMYPGMAALFGLGVALAFIFHDAMQFSRIGNLIIGVGVWMTMRYTLREGISRYKDLAEREPTVRGTNQLNVAFFNRETFLIGDANLQVRGFVIVILGSLVSSYGDLLLHRLFPRCL